MSLASELSLDQCLGLEADEWRLLPSPGHNADTVQYADQSTPCPTHGTSRHPWQMSSKRHPNSSRDPNPDSDHGDPARCFTLDWALVLSDSQRRIEAGRREGEMLQVSKCPWRH